jgi:hypothetical protein
MEINTEVAIAELMPLAENYLTSEVYQRVEQARALAGENFAARPNAEIGFWSEVPFRLRRPRGMLTGAIDKLLVLPASNGRNFDIEIIDFKTNRLRTGRERSLDAAATMVGQTGSHHDQAPGSNLSSKPRAGRAAAQNQFAFNFDQQPPTPEIVAAPTSTSEWVHQVASDYHLQMQAYALAVNELMPSLGLQGGRLTVTLHFLDPNVEYHLPSASLSRDACARAIDEAMMDIIVSHSPAEFPVRPAPHCRMCNFLSICRGGSQWLRANEKQARTREFRRAEAAQ